MLRPPRHSPFQSEPISFVRLKETPARRRIVGAKLDQRYWTMNTKLLPPLVAALVSALTGVSAVPTVEAPVEAWSNRRGGRNSPAKRWPCVAQPPPLCRPFRPRNHWENGSPGPPLVGLVPAQAVTSRAFSPAEFECGLFPRVSAPAVMRSKEPSLAEDGFEGSLVGGGVEDGFY
jgi:hypothetical protein